MKKKGKRCGFYKSFGDDIGIIEKAPSIFLKVLSLFVRI